MKKLSILILLVILITNSVNATTTIHAPAVDANGNGVVTTITATATPGSGKMRTDIANSLIAQDTEESIRNARAAATKLLKINPNNYDINIDISTDAQLIDGPSGGLAIALIIYKELAPGINPLRQDLTVTGTITANGEIGPVGGVEEKIQAAAKNKIKLALIAKGQSYADALDYPIYATELTNSSLQVIEVKNLTDAVQYAFSRPGEQFPNAPKTAIQQLNLTPLETSAKTEPFKQLAQNELNNAIQNLDRVKNKYKNDPHANKINANLRAINASIKTAQNSLNKGYYYTAANTAFLLNIHLQTILLQDISQTQFNALLNETQLAIDNFKAPNATTENFEEIAAAKLRNTWAKNKINQIKQDMQENLALPAAYLEDVITAKTWAEAATKMLQLTPNTTSTEINEYNLRPLALTLLKQANALNSTSEEFLDHIQTAKLAIAESNYITATYDLQYALAFQKADQDIEQNQTRQATNTTIQNVYIDQTSTWAELYYANALYNYQQAQQNGDEYSPNALRLTYLAQNFAQNHQDILNEHQNPRPEPNMAQEETNPAITNTANNSQNTQTNSQEITIQTPNDSSQKQINATVKITPKTDIGLIQAIGLTLIVIALATLTSLILITKTKPKPTDNRTKLEKLDDALIEGKITEATYKRLTEKYAPKPPHEKPTAAILPNTTTNLQNNAIKKNVEKEKPNHEKPNHEKPPVKTVERIKKKKTTTKHLKTKTN